MNDGERRGDWVWHSGPGYTCLNPKRTHVSHHGVWRRDRDNSTSEWLCDKCLNKMEPPEPAPHPSHAKGWDRRLGWPGFV